MANHSKNITIEGVRAAGTPVHHASFFEVNEVDGDVMLDVGVIDDQQLIKALGNPIDADVVVNAHVSHRFGMSARSLVQLQTRVNELVAKLQQSGAISG